MGSVAVPKAEPGPASPDSSVVVRAVVVRVGWIVRLGGEDCGYQASNPPAQEVHLEGDEDYDC